MSNIQSLSITHTHTHTHTYVESNILLSLSCFIW